MKKIVISLLILLLSISTVAQKNVNVDNYRFSFKERSVPNKKFEPRSFYYAPEFTLPRQVTQAIDQEELFGMFNIEGQRKIEDSDAADMAIVLKMEPIKIVTTDIKNRVEEQKNKEGKVIKSDHYYWVEVVYNTTASGTVFQKEKQIDNYNIFSALKNFAYKSQEYSTWKDASNFWRSNSDVLREQFTREVASQFMREISQRLSSDYGFAVKSGSGLMKTINEKKHPENDALRAKADELKARFETLNGTIPMQEDDIADIINYFKEIPTRYPDLKVKADIRLRYVAYYNLARIYLFLDQPEKVKEWADLILENGHDKKDSERLASDATKLAEYFNSTDVKTRQFNPDRFFPAEVEEEVVAID